MIKIVVFNNSSLSPAKATAASDTKYILTGAVCCRCTPAHRYGACLAIPSAYG